MQTDIQALPMVPLLKRLSLPSRLPRLHHARPVAVALVVPLPLLLLLPLLSNYIFHLVPVYYEDGVEMTAIASP
jgi:hypothetical protein